MINKFKAFGMICLYIVGVLGGLGWSLYNHSYVIAAGIVALGFMAFPEAKRYLEELMSE